MDLRKQVERLNKIGIALSGETNLRTLLELILLEARGFTDSDAGSLYIKEDDKLSFEVAQNNTLDKRSGGKEVFKPFPLPMTKKSIAGYAAITGKILNIEDVYEIPATEEYSFNPDFDKRNNYRTKSMLVVPMMDHEEEIIGVLQLINSISKYSKVNTFDKEYEDLVSSLASQAAVAIRNARLIDDIKRLFESLVQYSASAIDARSPHTAGHSKRVAQLAIRVAKAINKMNSGPFAEIFFTQPELEELGYAAWLHDIGKIGVREFVLEKANKLSDDRIDSIMNRFALIKSSIEKRFMEEKIIFIESGRKDEEYLKEIEEGMKRDIKEVDEDIEFLTRINKSNFTSDEDIKRLRNISKKRYLSSSGKEEYYLTEFEYNNLSVRKGNLTPDEYKIIQSHVMHTINILNNIPFTKNLKKVPVFAAAHHEMLNGTGYPGGLKDREIPVQARILCIVDIFDALTAGDRPYRPSIPLDKALNMLRSAAKENCLDSNIVELFISERLYEDIDN